MNTAVSSTPLDPHVISWLRDALRVGSDVAEIMLNMKQQGLSDESILSAFELVRPTGDALEQGVMQPPLMRRAPAKLRKIDTDQLDLYILEYALSANDCARMIALIAHHLRPSTLAYPSDDKAFRTSQTADLCYLKSPVATSIDFKICKTLGIRPEYAEGIQAQRYDVGQQFKAHWDWYEPDTHVYQRFASVRGNRTWTFMVYLNEDLEGGATRFTEIDFAVTPKTGRAVIWNNLNPDGTVNRATKHCGEPVTRGAKIIITKWFREFGEGPLFY
jgi:prolyl 4-hydroxylase